MAKRKGPTPPRRLNRADVQIAKDFQELDALVGRLNLELADALRENLLLRIELERKG